MKKILSLILSLFGLTSLFTPLFSQTNDNLKPADIKKKFTKEVICNIEVPYLLYLPKNYEETADNFPLLIFLHGSGERGTDLDKVKFHGPPKLISEGKEFPFIVVSPQCPEGRWWQISELNYLLDELITGLKIDVNRIYLTGLSMGGYGTWAWAEYAPNRFAAIAPVCGGGNPLTISKIGKMPVWAFHGAKDFVVPVAESERLINKLKTINPDVKFTVYPEAGHDAWTETYNNPELYEWFLKQSLNTK
ncbi:MAG: prolyl oligopeptidase family serine peptidase [Ignavibacteria bacterium]|nr:prolyl oligopeptidase family serine peptidase [Ignavibacteria bacterium]